MPTTRSEIGVRAGVGGGQTRVAAQLAAVLGLTLRGGVAALVNALRCDGVAADLAAVRSPWLAEVALGRGVRCRVDRTVGCDGVVVAIGRGGLTACHVVGEGVAARTGRRLARGGLAGVGANDLLARGVSGPGVACVVANAGRGLLCRVVDRAVPVAARLGHLAWS